MKEFDYSLDYENLDFTDEETRSLYRIGRGEQGVLLVRPYYKELHPLWRFKNETLAYQSVADLYRRYRHYKEEQDFIGMDMVRKFLEMGFTRSRRYCNHKSGRKYRDKDRKDVLPQEEDHATCEKSKSAAIFLAARRVVAGDPDYVQMRKEWRSKE